MLFISLILALISVMSYQPLHAKQDSLHAGSFFILTLPTHYNHQQIQSWLEQTRPAGVMLMGQHCAKRSKTKELTHFLQAEAQKLGLKKLLIAIDWEGGIVSRPCEAGGFASVPSPWSLAHAGRSACFLGGMLIGSQLQDVGVNVNFAPSLDLFDPDNCTLATRCFAIKPEDAAEYGIAFAQGLMTYGIVPVIKHFPGLGLGKKDTHLNSVAIACNKTTFHHHVMPFDRALKDAHLPAVMPTHAAIKQLDSLPATLSPKVTAYILEKNPDALIITDDFSMKAVQADRSLEEAALQSLLAGNHCIIFSGTPEDQIGLIGHITTHLNNCSPDEQQHLNERSQQINAFRANYLATCKKPIELLSKKQEAGLACSLAEQCIWTKGTIPSIQHKSVQLFSVDMPKLRPATSYMHHNKSLAYTLFNSHNVGCEEVVLNPKDQASTTKLLAELKTLPKNAIVVVQTFFYADGIWNKVQQEWLEALDDMQDRLIILSLGHPYEQTILPYACVIHMGSFHKPVYEVAIKRICAKSALTGADQLLQNPGKYLAGKKFALLCHACSVGYHNNTAQFMPDALYAWAQLQNDGTKLVTLLCPEHGLLGNREAGARVDSSTMSKWGCTIHSLYGTNKKPTSAMLKDLDLIIIDFQDVGARCFTYVSTLKLTLEAAAEQSIPVVVLDRPNPVISWGAVGPMLEEDCKSFVGDIHIPFLYGMTIGQLAQHINKSIGVNLTVLSCKNIPDDFFMMRTLIPPSPNLWNINQIITYPMTVFVEGTNYSEGRGTLHAFQQIGAPWVDGQKLADTLNAEQLDGVYFQPVTFTPQSMPGVADNPKHVHKKCGGVFFHIYDKKAVKPIVVAEEILATLFKLYPAQSTLVCHSKRYFLDLLAGTPSWRRSLTSITGLVDVTGHATSHDAVTQFLGN